MRARTRVCVFYARLRCNKSISDRRVSRSLDNEALCHAACEESSAEKKKKYSPLYAYRWNLWNLLRKPGTVHIVSSWFLASRGEPRNNEAAIFVRTSELSHARYISGWAIITCESWRVPPNFTGLAYRIAVYSRMSVCLCLNLHTVPFESRRSRLFDFIILETVSVSFYFIHVHVHTCTCMYTRMYFRILVPNRDLPVSLGVFAIAFFFFYDVVEQASTSLILHRVAIIEDAHASRLSAADFAICKPRWLGTYVSPAD